MSKLSQLLLSTALGCIVHLTQAATHIDPLISTSAVSTDSDLDERGVQKIQRSIVQNQDTLRFLKNKDIIVFLGDTGAGKSTLINLLAGIPLKTDTRGNVVTRESDSSGMRIGSGGHSVTKHPQYIAVDGVGILCDLPGFEDTDGALDDVINASLIRSILLNARSVKAVFVASGSEIDAVRGAAFKRLMQSINMFSNKEVPNSSSLLVVNKLDREQTTHDQVVPILGEIISTQDSRAQGILSRLIQLNKLVVVPKSRYGDKEDFLAAAKQDFQSKLGGISSILILPEQLNMAITFNAETTSALVNCFYNGLQALLAQNESVLNSSTPDKSFEQFQSLVSQGELFNLLSPLSHQQYRIAIKNFRAFFEKEHALYQQKKLAEKTKIEADLAEKKRLEAVEEQRKAQLKAEAAIQKAQQLESARIKAEQTAAEMNLAAERIKQDVSRTQREKEQAIRQARASEAQKLAAEKEALEQRELSKQMQAQQQQSFHRMKQLEAAQQRAQQEAENIESRLRQQYQNAARDKDHELASLRSDLRALQQEQQDTYSLRRRISQLEQEQGNIRDLRSQIERLQEQLSEKNQEIRQLRSRQQQGGGGHVLVQTPFGLQLMPQGGFGGGFY
jgi:energy-coupling factor transporter ATP-binding protein EcfA2